MFLEYFFVTNTIIFIINVLQYTLKNNIVLIYYILYLLIFFKTTVNLSYNIFIIFILSFFWVFLLFFINLNLKGSYNYLNLLNASTVILFSGYIMTSDNSIYFTIVGFEFMLLSSLYLLKNTLKTDRGLEAFIEMYIWGIFGSFFLLTGLVLNYKSSTCLFYDFYFLSDLFILLGFSIKIPLWPFTSWLLKAHVEASTEFSIFLSGFLVKFGVLGCFMVLSTSSSTYIFNIMEVLSTIGIIDACLKLFSQVDLKRIVALTTIIETNWLMLCFSQNNVFMFNLGLFLIFVHCLTTTLEFYIVEVIYKRYGTRSLVKVNSLELKTPIISKFFTMNLLITIGLPGTSIFIIKFFFLSCLLFSNFFIFLIVSFIFLIIMPTFFIRVYLIVNCGYNNNKNFLIDITRKELIILSLPILLSLVLGFILSIII